MAPGCVRCAPLYPSGAVGQGVKLPEKGDKHE